MMRFLAVFGERELKKVNGKSCWVESDYSKIYKIEPLHKNDGRVFDIEEWTEWNKSMPDRPSAHEMLYGKK